MMIPNDRTLRALLFAACEGLVAAERSGRWLDAIPAIDSLASELRRRAAGTRSPEDARADRDLADGGSK